MKYLLPIGLLALAGCGNPDVGRYQTVTSDFPFYLQTDTATGQTRHCVQRGNLTAGFYAVCSNWADPTIQATGPQN